MKAESVICVGLLAGLAACSSGGGSGESLLLTYNVAGLPEGLSGSQPAEFIPQISPELNGYELVLVQEDFWYHQQLAAAAEHPHRSQPMWPEPDLEQMGDGLNRFSRSPFDDHRRDTWSACHGVFDSGSDCLTTKGFASAWHRLGPNGAARVLVVNLHLDAGSADGDQQARREQVEQLIAALQARAADQALIVAGDTNLKPERADRPLDAVAFDRLLSATGLRDSCRALDCPQESIDRVLFRSGPAVQLTPLRWSRPPEFVTEQGEDLSDHRPVAVLFSWARSSG